MTKEELEEILRYYSLIDKEVKKGKREIIFYVGKRKKVLSEEGMSAYEVIKEFYNSIKAGWRKRVLNELMQGKRDVAIVAKIPYSRNAYYAEKHMIKEKIYELCIYEGLVSKEEIINGK